MKFHQPQYAFIELFLSKKVPQKRTEIDETSHNGLHQRKTHIPEVWEEKVKN